MGKNPVKINHPWSILGPAHATLITRSRSTDILELSQVCWQCGQWTLTKLIHCNRTIQDDSHTSRRQLLFLENKHFLGLTNCKARCFYFLSKQLFIQISCVSRGHTSFPRTQFLPLFVMWCKTTTIQIQYFLFSNEQLLHQFVRDDARRHSNLYFK